ncbi:MAG: TonB-dependent receptor [Gemmatimonadetes bacterium]|nr:TonB-dependent receptor [Gemmatimonadota bacterium]
MRLMLVLALIFPGALRAQVPRDTFKLSEIVVTATRLPTSRASVASAVTVISGEQLRSQGIRNVADALRAAPGAAVVQNGSFGAVTSLFLRGGESDYVQVLVDGVAVNGAGGWYDFAGLTTDNVDRIEIVAGPTSVLYGSDAVSGVVQVFTRRGRGSPTVEAGLQGGTYHSVLTDAALRGGDDRADYSFALSRFTTDGSYTFNNNHRNAVASGRVRIAPDERTDATLSLRYGDGVFHYPTDGAGRLDDRNQFTFGNGTTIGLEAGRFLSDRVEARLQLASHEAETGSDDQPDSPGDTLGFYGSESMSHSARRSADLRTNVRLPRGTIATAGAQITYQNARDFSQFSSQFGPLSSQSAFHRLNRGYYVQAMLEPVRRVSLTVGGRLDDNETFGTFATYRVGGSFRWAANSRLRVSIGSGFKEPAFGENFNTGFSTGNPNLRPEQSGSWEVGVEHTAAGIVFLSATYFSQRFRDLVQYTFTPPTPGGPNYFNVAAADASGLEVAGRTALPGGIMFEGSYTYLQTAVTDAGFDTGPDATFVSGERLLRRPASAVSLRATWKPATRGSLGAEARYVGDRADRDFARFPSPRVVLPGYAVLDASGQLDVLASTPGVTIILRLENLLNRRYHEIANFPARGRTVMIGGKAKF